MDLNNITAEQQKGLEFLKVRFMSELEDIKSKIVQLNKPFPDDLTTHLQNSFLNKELLFPPSQQIGLKKDQRKEQLERLKGDENERQYLGRIKLSLEKFAEAGMRQDLENKLLGIVQNPKLTSNKRMSAFFVLMHSLGFGFKRTSDFIVWAFGQMWVYENRRIAKERKSKMKKSKQDQKQDNKNKQQDKLENNDDDDDNSQDDNNSNSNLDDDKQKDDKQASDAQEMSNLQKLQNDNYQLGLGQQSNIGNLSDFGLQQQQLLSQLPLDVHSNNILQGGNLGNLNYEGGGSPKNISSMDRKELEQKIEILTRQVSIYSMLQSKQDTRIKNLTEQNDEKTQQLQNFQEQVKYVFQEFIVQLFQLLNQNNVSQEVQQRVQSLAQQHQYVLTSQNNNNSNSKLNYEQQNYDEINGILGAQKRTKTNNDSNNNYSVNNQTQSQQLGGNFMDQNLANINLELNNNFGNFPKIETKVEHLQLNSNNNIQGFTQMNNLGNYKNGTNDFQFIQNNLTSGLGLNNNNGGIYQGMALNTGLSMNNINGLSTTLPQYNLLGNDFANHHDLQAYMQQQPNLMGKDQ